MYQDEARFGQISNTRVKSIAGWEYTINFIFYCELESGGS
jgi:hypothetical protein